MYMLAFAQCFTVDLIRSAQLTSLNLYGSKQKMTEVAFMTKMLINWKPPPLISLGVQLLTVSHVFLLLKILKRLTYSPLVYLNSISSHSELKISEEHLFPKAKRKKSVFFSVLVFFLFFFFFLFLLADFLSQNDVWLWCIYVLWPL